MADEPTISIDWKTAPIRRHKMIQWTPAEDITALEVAQALPLLLSMSKDPLNYWEDYIPEKLRRHFRIEDQK